VEGLSIIVTSYRIKLYRTLMEDFFLSSSLVGCLHALLGRILTWGSRDVWAQPIALTITKTLTLA